ncbi:M48 family metalloprotease [Sphingobium sp. CCH11-B1]|uniref:M48 family metalloprotease n=1 Tax=Sphingobium sp. CCH11-B1 TaxID=1768781 RepID=UPI00082FE559|nr:M48 family metalloprotease [Sphingobium sp. CCH11-B1]
MARLLQFLALALASLALMARPAFAQQILRDAETEAFMADMSAPLVKAAGMEPRNVQVLVINDPEINAFVAGGQYVWVHSGLIAQADNVNQLQGVVAHELGHIEGGHIIRSGEGIKEATGITLLSLVLGAAAIAGGAGEAGYLHTAGISGRGSLEFFKKLQNQEYRLAIPQDNSYGRTHPLSGERIQVLREVYEPDPAWNRPSDPYLEKRFERIKAKLIGFASEPQQTLIKYPESDQSIPAHYARAYAWHKSAYPDRALAETDALLAALPHDPYFLELKGQILLESGKPKEAIAPLREAVKLTNQPLISTLLAHALIASEDEANFAEAEQVLRLAVQRDRENPFAWYQLGVVYERRGDTPRAALATAERYSMIGQDQMALRSADAAMQGLKPGTVDYLRAQDIAMVSRAAIEQQRKKR